ncbi:MAG: energy transducer TonB [Gammaproteobacteria bacterium]
MTAHVIDSAVTDSDRLSLTLCLAILFHAIIILGVSFIPPKSDLPNYETMDIVLVNSQSDEKPEDTKLLAQANQLGGGDTDEQARPATPLTTPVPAAVAAVPMAPAPQITPELPAPATPPPTAAESQTATADTATPPAEAKPQAEENASATQVMAAEAVAELDHQLAQPEEAKPEEPKQTEAVAKEEPRKVEKLTPPAPAEKLLAESAPATPSISGAALIARSFEIASLNAEIAARMEAKAKRPRRKFISATTQEYKFAAYMEAWRAKVERVGNLNYPDEARRKRLSGSLILDVALNADGSISEIVVRKPSGFPSLDDAAVRIVKLASPYAAFPDAFKKEVDILHITRTWQFDSGDHFASQ